MLRQVADGVLVSESRFMQSNTVVVQGRAGVLLIDPGILESEMLTVADDLRELGQPVVAGFSTHPHWDHLLWHAEFGQAPRYGTDRCASTVRARLPDAAAKARVTTLMPPDIVGQVSLELLGLITGLPAEAGRIPWDGPEIRIVEHQGHAAGRGRYAAAAHVGDGAQQGACVGVGRVTQYLGRSAGFDDCAGIENDDAVADFGDGGQVVRDQQDAAAVGVGGVAELAQDLAGQRHVEAGGRFVGDQQAGGAAGREGDHDALGHAA